VSLQEAISRDYNIHNGYIVNKVYMSTSMLFFFAVSGLYVILFKLCKPRYELFINIITLLIYLGRR
jgi:hypothetical protein